MKCRIKKESNNTYFNKYIGGYGIKCHWTGKEESKIFESVAEARATIKVYDLKKVIVEKERKSKNV